MLRDFDIVDTVQCIRYYAGWADKIVGQARIQAILLFYFAIKLTWLYCSQTIEVDNRTKLAFTRHDPIGVCGQMCVCIVSALILVYRQNLSVSLGTIPLECGKFRAFMPSSALWSRGLNEPPLTGDGRLVPHLLRDAQSS